MAELNPQAVDLNNQIAAANPNVLEMLSQRGRGIFFPAKGILGQTAEAKGKKINATIGIALEDDGTPMRLASVVSLFQLPPADALPYAPSYGKPELRQTWQGMIRRKNPSLGETPLSLPVVTCALTHALSICGYLFLDEDDALYLPDLYWGNYKLVFSNGYGARIVTHNTFRDDGYDVAALRQALAAGPVGKKVVLLNFPNNPTGYTATPAEGEAIRDALVEAAEAGNQVVALIDDAYFGLVYEENVMTESMFSHLATAHERLLAVKIDGATKEDYVWGLRVGFITYSCKGSSPELLKALEAKTAGAIRGNISNAPHISQSAMLKAYTSDSYDAEKQGKYVLLRRRAEKIKAVFAAHPEYGEVMQPLPFNSGYFMCVKPLTADPEAVRQLLLAEFSTGVIAASGCIRVAFSATPFEHLEELFDNLYQAVSRCS